MSAVDDLRAQGQSIWLDYIRRSLLTSGKLAEMVRTGGVTGVTSNPAIFEKAIVGSADYDTAIRAQVDLDPDVSLAALFESLAVDDVRTAADVLRPVFDSTAGADGFVSLEVSPTLAHDTEGTVAEARRLWQAVGRPNLLVKVPGTAESVPAIERLIAEGISVNVTLLFSADRYDEVAEAYLRGLARAPEPARVSSVASFFVSRVDTAVDRALDAIGTPDARQLRGSTAIANAREAYQRYLTRFRGPRFEPLRQRGARPQRLLWASTSTKDPAYRDTLYVEELIGPETVDTIPPATLEAFRDHGTATGSPLVSGVTEARATLVGIAQLGIDLPAITAQLLVEGVAAFADSFATLLNALEAKRSAVLASEIPHLPWTLGTAQAGMDAQLAAWGASDAGHRFWKKDPTLWPQSPPNDVATRMGWIGLPDSMHGQLLELNGFAQELQAEGFHHVVVLGMGGSSLAPDVFARTFPGGPGAPALSVLDSTHPVAIAALTARLDLDSTVFVVSSKSGTTLEPLSFCRYFWQLVSRRGRDPRRQFVAVTDPGTPLETLANERGFRRVFRATPDVGGRYSALTAFGLVPAAAKGVDLAALLDRAYRMAEACAFCVPPTENPGFGLAAALGAFAAEGRDKITFLATPPFESFPSWAEQLIAESTGKSGRGLIPVVDEPPLPATEYGPDRLFVSLESSGRPNPRVDELVAAGQPVIRMALDGTSAIGGEFFRWETGIAMVGPLLGIDPFDQPDVELAKELARSAMATTASGTALPPGAAVRADDAVGLPVALAKFLSAVQPGDYVGLQAYLAPQPAIDTALQAIRGALLARRKCATTSGYGPRFLHSTGQLHKGGPATGRFLQFVDAPTPDLPVPETDYTFGKIIRAQALGDLQALLQRGRTVLRVELGGDAVGGLAAVERGLHG
ncbi:MAG: bifunctional transaldolase/phosoglucose isomerase [Thermoplasmata archaeon]|nr:bifunctional transaldolase/phosoglucose isomerase [Thermoplasmata archaeon]